MHGDYVIIVRIHDYSNPRNTGVYRGLDNCCDDTRPSGGVCNTTIGRCDNRFTFCMKTLGDSADGTTSCMSEVLMTSVTNFNDAPIDFTWSTWLGLDNPLRLNGISTAWQVTTTDDIYIYIC